MISGSVRDAEKPIIIVAPGGLPSVWLRVRGSHDVQSSLFTAAHQQDGYPDATESRCSLSTIQKSLLDGGVHTRLLGGNGNGPVAELGTSTRPRAASHLIL